MSEEMLINLGRESVFLAIQLAGPMLIVGLIAGVAISVLQAVTQIQEATLSFVPKMLGVAGALLVFMPWMIQKMVSFTMYLFGDFRYFIQ